MPLLTKDLVTAKICSMNPQTVLDHFGSQAAMARALGIKQPSVFAWFKSGRIPYPRQCQIEVVTGGKVKAARPK